VPQALLPLIPDGATQINARISVVQDDGQWTYFCGVLPMFQHRSDDRAAFRMFTAQLIDQGSCRQAEIIKTFGVAKNSVQRSVTQIRQEGVKSFFRPRPTRSANVLTPPVTARAQELLYRGWSRSDVAEELGIKRDTLRKAINQGRLQEPARGCGADAAPPGASASGASSEGASPVSRGMRTREAATPHMAVPEQTAHGGSEGDGPAGDVPPAAASDKSQRTAEDADAEMGMACTRPVERVAAALGLLDGAPTEFQSCRGVSFGGVLCALPALTQNGLFDHLDECFPSLSGYYTTTQVVSLLAIMALCRIKTVEQLQYESPGELGKLLGLDRVPEVRCLRNKLKKLSRNKAPKEWAGRLSRDWLAASEELAGTLYVDGHVRLYHGKQTPLPPRYVSRQRLCLRGTTGYWVNDALGQPFFVVDRPIDQGLLEALESDIVPRLLEDVPGQPTEEELAADRYRHRFLMVFDREGYSPKFFRKMWTEHRIACLTYHKYPKEDWPLEWFQPVEATLPAGESVSMDLAELGSWIGDRKTGLMVREVRKLCESGHQTSLISTAYRHESLQDAVRLFSRWSQENFFRYMRQHFGIDLLSEYQTEKIPGTKRPVVNPPWRELDRQSRSLKTQLTRRQARFAALTLHPEDDEKKRAQWERRKATLREEIEHLEHKLNEVREQKKETPQHIAWEELSDDQQFRQLAPSRKQLIDTVKMIAYRAETAMTNIVREKLAHTDDARSLLRNLFCAEADLSPDAQAGLLRVHVHSMANARSNRAIEHLLTQLNAAERTYPGTTFKLVYSLAAARET